MLAFAGVLVRSRRAPAGPGIRLPEDPRQTRRRSSHTGVVTASSMVSPGSAFGMSRMSRATSKEPLVAPAHAGQSGRVIVPGALGHAGRLEQTRDARTRLLALPDPAPPGLGLAPVGEKALLRGAREVAFGGWARGIGRRRGTDAIRGRECLQGLCHRTSLLRRGHATRGSTQDKGAERPPRFAERDLTIA